ARTEAADPASGMTDFEAPDLWEGRYNAFSALKRIMQSRKCVVPVWRIGCVSRRSESFLPLAVQRQRNSHHKISPADAGHQFIFPLQPLLEKEKYKKNKRN